MPKRCKDLNCRKRLPTVPLKCRCGKYYCMSHLSSHSCTIDFLKLQQLELTKTLETAVNPKVEAI
jgi:hypothetical protein